MTKAQSCEVCITKKAASKCKAQAINYGEMKARGLEAEAIANQCQGQLVSSATQRADLQSKVYQLQHDLLNQQIKAEYDKKIAKRAVKYAAAAGLIVGILGAVVMVNITD